MNILKEISTHRNNCAHLLCRFRLANLTPENVKEAKSKGGLSALHCVLWFCSGPGILDLVMYLVKLDPDCYRKQNNFGNLAIHCFPHDDSSLRKKRKTEQDQLEARLFLNKLYPEGLKHKNKDGVTPLVKAIRLNYNLLAAAIIKQYPELAMFRDRRGKTPLNHALELDNNVVVEAILTASPEAILQQDTKNERTILWHALAIKREQVPPSVTEKVMKSLLKARPEIFDIQKSKDHCVLDFLKESKVPAWRRDVVQCMLQHSTGNSDLKFKIELEQKVASQSRELIEVRAQLELAQTQLQVTDQGLQHYKDLAETLHVGLQEETDDLECFREARAIEEKLLCQVDQYLTTKELQDILDSLMYRLVYHCKLKNIKRSMNMVASSYLVNDANATREDWKAMIQHLNRELTELELEYVYDAESTASTISTKLEPMGTSFGQMESPLLLASPLFLKPGISTVRLQTGPRHRKQDSASTLSTTTTVHLSEHRNMKPSSPEPLQENQPQDNQCFDSFIPYDSSTPSKLSFHADSEKDSLIFPEDETTSVPSNPRKVSLDSNDVSESIANDDETTSLHSNPSKASIDSNDGSGLILREDETISVHSNPRNVFIDSNDNGDSIMREGETALVHSNPIKVSLNSNDISDSILREKETASVHSNPRNVFIDSNDISDSILREKETASVHSNPRNVFIDSNDNGDSILREDESASVLSNPIKISINSNDNSDSTLREDKTTSAHSNPMKVPIYSNDNSCSMSLKSCTSPRERLISRRTVEKDDIKQKKTTREVPKIKMPKSILKKTKMSSLMDKIDAKSSSPATSLSTRPPRIPCSSSKTKPRQSSKRNSSTLATSKSLVSSIYNKGNMCGDSDSAWFFTSFCT
jgi:hypothetical protein